MVGRESDGEDGTDSGQGGALWSGAMEDWVRGGDCAGVRAGDLESGLVFWLAWSDIDASRRRGCRHKGITMQSSRKPTPAAGLFDGLESLEQRRLLSADLTGSTLRVEGTDAADVIVIEAGESGGEVILSGVDGVEDGSLFSGVDRIRVRLGDGDDSATVLGAMRTTDGQFMDIRIAGNLGDDQLFGGDSLDTLIGGPGDDVLDGGLHDDELRGGADNDVIRGGDGDDFIQGGRNADVVRGHDGSDQLLGGRGFDEVIGGGGSDNVNGGWGNDMIVGGAGSDAIHGDKGSDVLRGGGGADEIHGDGGSDDVLGGIGRDWLFGGEGDDSITGGDGSDTILAPAVEVRDRSDEDAKWTDAQGNELDFDGFSDDFWTALGTASDALRSGNVDRIDSTLSELSGALNERADAFFDLLGEVVDDAPVRPQTFTRFEQTVSRVAENVEQFFVDLANEVVDDSQDSGGNGTNGDGGNVDEPIDLTFLEGEHVPPAFLEAIDILKDAAGGELPEGFWTDARRLLDNQGRFLARLETLTTTLSIEQLDGLKDRVDLLMEALFDDGFDPRVNPDAFAAEVRVRLGEEFTDLGAQQRTALEDVIVAAARRDSAAEKLEETATGLVQGELPEAFWEAWDRAGDEANGIVDGQFPVEYENAIGILSDLLDGEIPGTFWDRLDAFMISIGRTGMAFDHVLDTMDDATRSELAPWIFDLVDELLDAGYEPGADVRVLMFSIDQEIAGRFSDLSDETVGAIAALLNADVREHQLEEGVFDVVIDLLGGQLPVEFIEAWESAEGDFSDEFGFLFQPHVPPSFIEAVDILRSNIDVELPEEFWDVARRLADNQLRFLERMETLNALLTPEQLDGLRDRVNVVIDGMMSDGFDPRGDLDAFSAELRARVDAEFQQLTVEQRDAMSGAMTAAARRDSVAMALEAMALDLAGGELPQEFWDAWERAGDEASGLVHDFFPPNFDGVFEVLGGIVDGEIPDAFWDRFDAYMVSLGASGDAFDGVMQTLDDAQRDELGPFVEELVDAVLDAGFEPGMAFEDFFGQVDPELAARFDGVSPETFDAITGLTEAIFREDAFEAAVFGVVADLAGGEVPEAFFDAWDAADEHGGGVQDLIGLDGEMPGEFFEALDVAQSVLNEPLSQEFFDNVELLIQSVGEYAGRFGDVLFTMSFEDQDRFAFALLDMSEQVIGSGWDGSADTLDGFIDQIGPNLRALFNGQSEPTRGVLRAFFGEGHRREALATAVETTLLDAAGDAMPSEFFELWEMAGDQMLGA